MPSVPFIQPESSVPVNDPGVLRGFIGRAEAEVGGIKRAVKNISGGIVLSASALDTLTANVFGTLDRAANNVTESTGLPYSTAFADVERFFREEAQQLAQISAEQSDDDLMSKIYQIIGGVPLGVATAATAVAVGGGPVVGFAALGALENADKGAANVFRGALEGAGIGKLFKMTEPLTRGIRAPVVGGTTTAAELGGGAELQEAALSGATLGTLVGITSPRRARIPIRRARLEEPTEQPPEGLIADAERTFQLRSGRTDEGTRAPKEIKIARPGFVVSADRSEAISERFLGRDFSDIQPPDRAINLNLNRVQGEADFKAMVAELVETIRPQITEARRGQITLEQTERLAGDLDMTVAELLKRRRGQAFNPEEVTAARILNRSVLEEWHTAANRISQGRATDQQKAEFMRLTMLSEASLQQTLGATAEAGRTLSALRIPVGPSSTEMKRIRKMIDDFKGPGKQSLEQFADSLSAVDNFSQLGRAAREFRSATTGEKFVEIWINWLVSGPKTQAVNFISNSFLELWAVPEAFASATVGSVRAGAAKLTNKPPPERTYFSEGLAMLAAIPMSGRERALAFARVMRTGRPESVDVKIETMRFEAITGVKGTLIRLPTRTLLAFDAFARSGAKRQRLMALGARDSAKKGLRGREFARNIDRFVRDPSPEALADARAFAAKQTFTEPLGVKAENFRKGIDSPAGRLIVPFVRISFNIPRVALRATPIGAFMKSVQEDVKAGGVRRDRALGKMALGTSLMSWAMIEAAQGNITGGGPTDPDLRRTWWLSNRPYSFRIPSDVADRLEGAGFEFTERADATGDAWVSFGRIEPLATWLGIAADTSEIIGQLGEAEADELAKAGLTATLRNIGNKTWWRGVSEAALAISDPDRYSGRFLNRLVATLLVPRAVSQIARNQDPVLREAQDLISTIKSQLLGYSSELPARFNLWGEPIFLDRGLGPDLISPFYSARITPDATTEEVQRVKAKLRYPEKTLNDVELGPFEYAEFVSLAGRTGKTLLDGLISSRFYQHLPTDVIKREIIESTYNLRARGIAREPVHGRLLQSQPERFVGEPRKKRVEELTGVAP